MKHPSAQIILITFVLVIGVCFSAPAMSQVPSHGSISGKVSSNNGMMPPKVNVYLVNGSNSSDYIPGFNTTTDPTGFFQFINVSPGSYSAYAWSDNYQDGFSAGINVTENATYTASVVLLAMPYYANITANPRHLTYGGVSDISATVYDYWGKPVSAGWQILLRSTAGILDPDSTFTDTNGYVHSRIGYVENVSYAEITIFAIAKNSSSYPLQENLTFADNASPTPIASVTPTTAASPTAVPNATVTVSPNATATPTAAPAASTPSPKPTPGFELFAILAAGCMAIAIKRFK